MSDILLSKVNEAFLHVDGERSTLQELADYFTFFAEGYQFMPAYRNKMWDGKIRLFDARNNTIYAGLLSHIEQFAQDRDYDVQYHDSSVGLTEEFSLQEGKEFVDTLKLPVTIRDYQLNAFVHAVRKKRCLLLSPTASGKSLIIYALMRYYEGKKALIIVPTTSLVSQLYKDFSEYGINEGWSSDNHVHYIMAGRDKQSDMPITISTWQSLYKMPKQYFDQYDVIVGDECLHPSSSITMSDGTQKTIDNINIGDQVLTINENNGKIESKPVIEVHKNISKHEQLYEIVCEDGRILKITGNHKVLLSTGKWCRADKLQLDDIINTIEYMTFDGGIANGNKSK